jgi:hypothetical protein
MFEKYQKYIISDLELFEIIDLMETNYLYPLQYIIYNMCVFINKNKLFSIILLNTFIFFLYLYRF